MKNCTFLNIWFYQLRMIKGGDQFFGRKCQIQFLTSFLILKSSSKLIRYCGCGSVGKAVTSDPVGPWFEPRHRQIFYWSLSLLTVNSIEKTKIKKKSCFDTSLKKYIAKPPPSYKKRCNFFRWLIPKNQVDGFFRSDHWSRPLTHNQCDQQISE